MKLEDLGVEQVLLDNLGWLPQPMQTIGMRKVLCMCHYKLVWVSKHEHLPYWCSQKQLHAPPATP